ncbi:hypothetical protein GCM10010964_12020 [Caldovatus sediminis]|uniref:Calcium-binding protein n=1 Tax=Caldovatus sediminis TaxID=2041189 RepID=A0A8J3EBF4_9PROT|nr:calcium-binding protein [Caldovatus sediminis]GGG25668.1 hypothetical protein GCM10010964_12020 [Caldovatus sediminis]
MSGFLSRISDLLQQIGESVRSELGGRLSDDTIEGTPGHDRLFGGVGNDVLGPTGAGNDLAVGGVGDDTITGGIGLDVLAGNSGDDLLLSTEGAGGVTLMFGGDGRDRLIAGLGDNLMFGGNGDDTLIGGGGYLDIAVGGDGSDILNTGTGVGVHIGGPGSDLFAVGPEIAGNRSPDVVIALDFVPGVDRVQIAPEVVASIVSIEDGALDFTGVLGLLRRHGVFSGDVSGRVSEAGEAPVEDQMAVLLSVESAPPAGAAVANGALATTAEGDLLFFAGITAAQLDQLV